MKSDPSLMITLCTQDAEVISTSPQHWKWLGRSKYEVIGHSCSEWSSPDFWDLSWNCFRHAVETGHPVEWIRQVIATDQTLLTSRITVKPITTQAGKPAALCFSRQEHLIQTPFEAAKIMKSIDLADYVNDIVQELSTLTAEANLPLLSQSLESVAGEAAAASHRLRQCLIPKKLT